MDSEHVVSHLVVGDLQVADRVVLEGLGVGVPYLDGVGHELTHGGLEVVVAHHPAGDARRTSTSCRLLDDDDVVAAARAAGLQFTGQVPRGGQTMDASTDDAVPDRLGKRPGVGHGVLLFLGGPGLWRDPGFRDCNGNVVEPADTDSPKKLLHDQRVRRGCPELVPTASGPAAPSPRAPAGSNCLPPTWSWRPKGRVRPGGTCSASP